VVDRVVASVRADIDGSTGRSTNRRKQTPASLGTRVKQASAERPARRPGSAPLRTIASVPEPRDARNLVAKAIAAGESVDGDLDKLRAFSALWGTLAVSGDILLAG
jgi:hypothetical protein